MFAQAQLGEKLITPRARFFEPFDLMKKAYDFDYEVLENTLNFKESDALFMIRARMWSNDIKSAIELPLKLFAHNYALLAELDDSPTVWRGYDAVDYADFRAVHAITCSTEPLAEELREFNPYVKVLKNQAPALLPEKSFESRDKVTIFFGALNRGDSWQDILPALNKTIKKYKNKLQFTVLSDMNFFNALETKNKIFLMDKTLNTTEYVPYNVYMGELYKSDIALLPLKDTHINRAKSDLKFIESANAQVAVLASPVVYESTVKDGETGFIYRTPKEFLAKLEILIKDRARRINMAKAAYEYVKRERLLVNHIEERFDWMKETYLKREELHRELIKRCEARYK